MKLDMDRLDELMANAREAFIEELKKMILRINTLMEDESPGLIGDDVKEILTFFHKINGTASTLGMERLAVIGRENKTMLKDLITSKKEIDNQVVKSIKKSIEDVKQGVDLIGSAMELKQTGMSYGNYTSMDEMGKILLIDDDVAMLKLLENVFTLEGYTVYICDDSLSAMDIIAVCKPDIILLDIMMPKCDGYEVLSRIKANPSYSDIFILFLSAASDIDNKIKGMRAGVDDYITKPFVVQEVVSRVEMILKRANKLKEKLLKDCLTGAYSRCHFNERIRDELERYKRYGTVFSMAFIDLDRFKTINDMYGHIAGDFVLQRFVSFMTQNLRESDCIFRYGGEEFVILLPDTDECHAYAAIDRLRERFCAEVMCFGGSEFTVTFSCGIKQADSEDKTVNRLISAADEALYTAKRLGRNGVCKFTSLKECGCHKKTILLVDDENTILKLLGSRLSEAGYNIVEATDGRRAIEAVGQFPLDAVILDLMLPDMNGMEVCIKIKENMSTRSTRVIILSQKSAEEDIITGLEYGADDYVTKPFSMGELEARIKRVLSR